MTIKEKLREILEQAQILANRKTTEEIAEYMENSNVIPFPVGVGDTVYFLSARAMWGSLLTAVQRIVDKIAYDGKIEIISYRPNENDVCGNLYGYWQETVFESEEKAEKALELLRRKAYDN